MGSSTLTSKWQDFCSLLLFWLVCFSSPLRSQCPSTPKLFLEPGTTTEMLQGNQTLPSPSTSGLVLSRRSSPSAESKELENFKGKKTLAFDEKKKKKKKKKIVFLEKKKKKKKKKN